MTVNIMPLEEFMKLDADQQVEQLKRYKLDYTLKDIREAWGLKHSAQYYMLLKKLRIYDRVVNRSDKFYPEQLVYERSDSRPYGYVDPRHALAAVKQDHFSYQLNVTLPGPELADKLERIAFFLKGENKRISVKLVLEAEESGTNGEQAAGESSEEQAAAASEG
ncbi:MAG: hypothetical protein A9Z00_08115 [Thermobacillus sp. ZCTH02-B1]|uniref:hypothetical protein n=1 Tax=Thermobacillus sp. ZCTH02-B1 TaxID=1858795 RepID=UPI000B551D27|nr:hypothetical protein [Thermobacillus sp. ZCTH02-B1]OUM95318.1 MAG: hypothetical protein A9Z00_08115 [Thermobacillus sp. ZCTH02-B1]